MPSSKKAPNHQPSKNRVNRARGQVEAIARMIDEDRYCPEIIQQIRAATNALKGLEQEILKRHLECCVREAMVSRDSRQAKDKVNEVIKLWGSA
jgi:DNA-binding FrmR family transcriptional regulator